MAYTNVYSEAAPLGSTAANLIDDLMRSGKLDIRERLESIFGTGIFTTDPVTVTQIKLTGASAKIIPGTVGLLIKDNADANINVNIADNGDFAVNRGRLFINSAISKIIPGVTSFSIRNNVDGADNIIVTDAGVVTLRNTVTITSGGLTVSAGGASITGTVNITGTFNVTGDENLTGNLVLSKAGVDIIVSLRGDSGKSKIITFATGSLNRWQLSSNNTVESGANVGSDLALNRYDDTGAFIDNIFVITRSTGLISLNKNILAGGSLAFSAAAAKIIGGPTSLTIRNNSDGADNLIVADNGVVTVRTGLTITAGGLSITSGSIVIGTAATQIIPGATSFSIRNNANAKDNLLITNGGQAIITGDAGTPPLVLDQLNVAAGLTTYVVIRRNGTIKARFGLDASDSFVITDSTGAASNLIAADNGNVTIRGALTVGSGTLALNIASGTILTLNSSTNLTTDVNQLIFQRGGSNKWRIGSNINGTNSDEFNIFNDASGLTAVRITNGTGAVLIPVSLQINGGGVIGRLVKASLTWNPGTVATGPGGTVSTTVTLTGAVVGDAVIFSNPWESDQAGCVLNAWVTSANTVTVTITQYSGSPTTFTSRTISVWIIG